MDFKDRRKHPRLEGHFPVDVLNMGDDPAVSPFEAVLKSTALDVSRQGMRLQTNYNVPVGSVLSGVVYFHGTESVCMCEVVWKREADDQNLYGLFIREWSKLDLGLEKQLSLMEKPRLSPAV
jgi:PilZ domain